MVNIRLIAARHCIEDYSDDVTISSRTVVRDEESPNYGRHQLPEMSEVCQHCGASYFKDEGASLCCGKGNVVLPSYPAMPEEIFNLWQDNSDFRKKIRKYNQVMSFCSLGAKVDQALANERNGVYTFRVCGQVHHQIGSAEPIEGEEGKFAQIYFFENERQTERRNEIFSDLQPEVLDTLRDVVARINPYVQLYKHAYEIGRNNENYKIVLKNACGDQHPGRYNPPTVAEVGCVLFDSGDEESNNRDVIINRRGGDIQQINELHAAYDPLMYILLLPFGSLGWHENITHYQSMRRVTLKEFAAYHLMARQIHRYPNRNPLHLGGRLFQQWVVDQYAKVESNNLNYIRHHQKELRTDTYANVTDAIANGDLRIGRRIVLPSSFIGSDRHMMQCYQDSMALVRTYGKADYFVTITCNPKWEEIRRELLPHQTASDRPDVVARVFNLKVKELITDLTKRNVLGRCQAYLYTIEFQKRGLPHAHILLWIQPEDKPRSPEVFDKCVFAELPDPEAQPILYKSVVSHMLHGPCGHGHEQSPCYDCHTQACTKRYPKQFQESTEHNDNGYPLYRRRNNGQVATKRTRGGNFDFDNRWVIPYNPFLLAKYDSHINVEVCSSIQSVKYIHKYVHKGGDRANVRVVRGENVVDEIEDYRDGRYISPVEACWRILGFKLHKQSHTIVRLPVHLENNEPVYFIEDHPGNVERPISKLDAYFQKCTTDAYARTLTYIEFPIHYTWIQSTKCWVRRTRDRSQKTIGRMYTVSIGEGERYFLRLLLTRVKGPTSYQDLRTYQGTIYPTYKEACSARGMFEDDVLWTNSLHECAQVASAHQLREFFVSLLSFSFPINTGNLWEAFKDSMGEDFRYRFNDATQDQIYRHTGVTIDAMLEEYGMSWDTYPGLPTLPEAPAITMNLNEDVHHNPLIARELRYETDQRQVQEDIASLNDEQRAIFELITSAVENIHSPDLEDNLFFLQGCGGTGKTFLNKTILDYLRSNGKIALAVASSGIASLLLPGGTTAHSRFKIPLELTQDSTCGIRVNSNLGKLLEETNFILWDEAPMVHRFAFEALNRTLKDVCNNNKPMGGKICLFSGDWRQILPVVLHASKAATVASSLIRSPIWRHVRILHLNQNMRVDPGEIEFTQWLLSVGNGTHHGYPILDFPNEDLVSGGTTEELIKWTYPDFNDRYNDTDYIKDRVILATTNKEVDEINDLMAADLGNCQVYHSIDSVVDEDGDTDTSALYTVEFLNSLVVNGLPPHILKLAVGSVVTLLRNLNKSLGLCNGTRLMVERLFPNCIEAKILTGRNVGRSVFIPRVKLSPSSSTLPFTFCRIQFPVKLAYAMTINKSQGQTFSRVGLSLLHPVFSHGQLYVALSRVRKQNQLKILLPPGTSGTRNIVYQEALMNI